MNNNTSQRNQNASSYSRGGQGCQVYQNGVRCGETKTLTIIQEFKQLYEDKMRIIDQEGSGDCGVQAKINLQQDWIRDLTEQNEMLVRAVEELEQEATERVLSLEEKLKQSSKCACEVMNGYRDISINLEEIFQRNGMLENDISNLVEFVRRIREDNSWCTNDLNFCTIDKEDLIRGSRRPERPPPDVLPDDKTINLLEEKERKIGELERQIENISKQSLDTQDSSKDNQISTLKQSMLDMRDALTAEVADKHDTIVMLRRDVQILEDQCRKADQQTHFKDDIIKELRKELKQLKTENVRDMKIKIRCLEEENEDLRLAVKKTTEELDNLEKLTKSHAIDKEKLQTCCQDYEDKISLLQTEQDRERKSLQECCRQFEDKILCLDAERRDYEVDEAKKRITNLEEELQQAWREKEKEVECARCCREQEIINLKEVINSLMKSLDNERQRSENLQKAVDLYLNSISVLQESEEQLKKEISDQRVTISNLQDALVAAKHSLEEHRQKANQDYVNMTQVIEKLRDENLILEVDLFYYFQDIEMYEMRVLKYQQLLRDLQGQCYKIHGEVQSLENQKVQQTAFVDDLSEQLSECQDELRHLFNVLTEEQSLVENESITLTNHIMTLQAEMCALSQKLAVTIQCLENEKKNNNVLEYQLNIRERESSCLTNEVYIMKEKLRQATNEIIAHQSKIICLQSKLQDYEKSITLLDEESEMCQNNIQYCFKNLKDAQMSLDKRNKEYDLLNIEYSKEAGVTTNLRIELQQARALYNEELDKCKHAIKHLQAELDKSNELHVKEIEEYIQSMQNLQEKLKEGEIRYKNTEEELSFAHTKLLEASETEVKLRGDHVETITELNGKINSYMNEQERLISVINNLEHRMSSVNEEIDRKDDQIAAMKMNLAAMQNTNVDQKQLYQEEICNMKNEINTLIQKQGQLKSENDKLQAQVSKYHTVASKNEEKGKLMVQELKQCLTELQTIQGDKEFLLQKNEQLAHEIQSLQDACQSKTESCVTLEMELNDTKCIRDTLCNESRNVINNVKVWLQEQRKINIELNNKIKQKNVLISQMNQEKIILRNKIKQMSSCGCTPSQGSGYPKSRTPTSTFSYRPHTPPVSGPSWTSYGSTESASCSSDSELDGTDMPPFGTPQVWIHRVESLTEKLQRKNLFWKSKMDEHDFVVSKDK